MTDSFYQSVSLWICDLKQGNNDADEEDVAVSVFNGLCKGAAAGRFDQLHSRDDLWSLLVAIAGKKAADQIRRQTSQKRGGKDLRGESVFQGVADEPGVTPRCTIHTTGRLPPW